MDTPLLLGGLLCAVLSGMAKTGLPGLGILVVPIMAHVWGDAKGSVGTLLPLLVAADIFSVLLFRRNAETRALLRIAPWVLGGLALGYVALREVGPEVFRPFLGGLILALLGLEFLRARLSWERLPHHPAFVAFVGVATGFSTMVGNVAGPVMSIYLLCQGMAKERFMGSVAWFFLIINLSKIPFLAHLGLIHAETLRFNALLLPGVVAGGLLGRWLLHHMSMTVFTRLVQGLALISGLWLLK
jgi:uncharacterized membrane protein YfcA